MPIEITDFIHQSPLCRVIFRPHAIDALGDELARAGITRPLLLAGGAVSRGAAYARMREQLGALALAAHEGVPPHSSAELVGQLAARARESGADGLIAIGGGSVSDTAKAVALLLAEGGRLEDHASRFTPPDRLSIPDLRHPKLPIIAIPTTASAAEVTPGLGVRNAEGVKLLFSDPKLACRVILIDPALNLEVPAPLMLATGMNGLAHCIEGLYARGRSPVAVALAQYAIPRFLEALSALAAAPQEMAPRAALLSAAHLSGQVLLGARTCLHHALCHVLGATTGIAHGDANAVMLPHAMAFNQPAAAELAQAARAAGIAAFTDDDGLAAHKLTAAVRELGERIGVPRRLRDLGVRREQLAGVAEHALGERGLYFNPRRVESAAPLLELLEKAW
ncbi:MAG: iron-containing alcohol dehydrogenase [Betaproteobacteria bacterium]|nr:iron-containing alcohol dehydrogenase [Betaproteobacteria bacterium]